MHEAHERRWLARVDESERHADALAWDKGVLMGGLSAGVSAALAVVLLNGPSNFAAEH